MSKNPQPSAPFLQETFRHLVGVNKGRMSLLLYRKLIPFLDDQKSGWNQYTYRQAFATRLALKLGGPLSGGYSHARTVVENYVDDFAKAFAEPLLSRQPLLFGYGDFSGYSEPGSDGKRVYTADAGCVAGQLKNLQVAEFVGYPLERIEFRPLEAKGLSIREVVLFDASEEAKKMCREEFHSDRFDAWVKGL